MANTRFRLESFRPWNPFQDKAQPLLDHPNICRYPSPVSITTTTPPPNSNDTTSKVSRVYPHKPEQHPLPARPPVEVCLDGGARPDSQGAGLEPGDSEPAVFTDQPPRASNAENPVQTRELPNTEAIDPAILSDHTCLGAEQIQATESIAGIAISPDLALADSCSSQGPRFSSEGAPSHSSRHDAKDTVTPNRQHSGVAKRSKAKKRHTRNDSSRLPSTGRGRRKSLSFPMLRSQFSALSVEDRLQFLSWLFEGALQHCVTSPSMITPSALTCCPELDAEMTYDCDQPNSVAEPVDVQHAPPTRKGLRWSEEEGRLLVELREEQNLPWSEVIEQFGRKFPGRGKGSIQVYWCTTLKKQRLSWSNHPN